MTIRVEFIRRRPGGRITVKPTVYDKKELSLGRATDCDIFLPDLRVGLHHARLTYLSKDRVRIETSEDHRVRVDGALLRRRDITIDHNSDIRIGPYQLALSRPDTPEDLLISVELVEPSTAVGEAGDESEVFSMQGYAPDRRASAWLLIAVVAAAFMALPVFAYLRGGNDSPEKQGAVQSIAVIGNLNWLSGGMSSAHANLVSDCRECHENAFIRVRDATCLSCHEDMRNHAHADTLALAAPNEGPPQAWLADLRARLNIPEGRCGSCHFEHNGPDGVTPSASGFCVDCHRTLDQRLPETELVNVINFARLHPEFKPRIIVEPHLVAPVYERVSLVDRPKEVNGLKFPHDFHLKDDEVKHKLETLSEDARARFGETLDCVDCHRIDAAGALFAPIEMETICGDCHSLAFSAEENSPVRSLPHGEPDEVKSVLEDFYLAQATAQLLGDNANLLDRQLGAEDRARRERLREQAFRNARASTQAMIERIFSEDGVCQKCHGLTGQTTIGGAPQIAPVRLTSRYLPKAAFSHAQHMTGNIECAACHRAETSSETADVLMPSITVCRTCHDDVRGKNAIASDCLTCHAYHDDDEAPYMTPSERSALLEGWPRR